MSFQNCKIRGRNCNSDEYHRFNEGIERGDPKWTVTSGMLREAGQCWARWKAGYAPPDSEAKDFGSLLDTLILTPGQFAAKYRVRPEQYKSDDGMKPWNNNAKVCRQWNDDTSAAGMKPLKATELAEAQTAVNRFVLDKILMAFATASDRQTWVIGEWKDDKTGRVIPCQALIDFEPRKGSDFADCLGDLKTTRSAHPRIWSKYSSQRGYHIQAAFYADLYSAATGDTRDSFCHCLIENFPPWQTGRSLVSLQKLEYGRMIYRAYLARYAECLSTGIWPDYNAHKGNLAGWSLDEGSRWDEMEAQAAVESVLPELDEEETPEEEGENIP